MKSWEGVKCRLEVKMNKESRMENKMSEKRRTSRYLTEDRGGALLSCITVGGPSLSLYFSLIGSYYFHSELSHFVRARWAKGFSTYRFLPLVIQCVMICFWWSCERDVQNDEAAWSWEFRWRVYCTISRMLKMIPAYASEVFAEAFAAWLWNRDTTPTTTPTTTVV